jgi:hypothetical protein
MKSKREILNLSKNKVLKSPHKNKTFRNISPSDEKIEIKVPTPYPQTQYMLIDDPNLINSKYTELLNEKFPQRKFLRHNSTSWNKCNKNKSKEISIKLLSPQIKFEDYNLKPLSYKGLSLDSFSCPSNLEEAANIIEMLKTKLLEYELTNNENIQTSLAYIQSIKEENEFLKNKILDGYEKINFVNKKYDLDVDEIYYDSKNLQVEHFKDKWNKIKAFYYLKSKTNEFLQFKYKYIKFKRKQTNILKLKALLSLEKNLMINSYSNKIQIRRKILSIKNIISSFKFNAYINKLSKKFIKLKRTISYMIYFKELKINVENSKYNKTSNRKSLFKYYLSLMGRSFCALKSITKNVNVKNSGRINYSKFFEFDETKKKNNNYNNWNNLNKTSKVRALQILQKILYQIIEVDRHKIINNRNKDLALKIYLNNWRRYNYNESKEINCKILWKKQMIKNFFREVKNITQLNKFNDRIKVFYYKSLIIKIKKLIHINKKISNFNNQMKILCIKLIFDHLIRKVSDQPESQFVFIFKIRGEYKESLKYLH